MAWRFRHGTTGNLSVAPAAAMLYTVNINTAAGSSTVTIYNNTSAVSADIVAVIDSASKGSHAFGFLCEKGIFVAIAGGTPDVTIGYE